MTKDEALDLALEALEKSLPRLAPYGEQDWLDSRAAITAIKQARAAPVQKPYRPLQDNGSQYFGDSWDTLPTQPAPVQEPVWIQPDHLQKAQRAPFLCRVEPHKRDDFVPLYTTPPAAPMQEPVGRVCFEGDEVVWTDEPPESGTLLYTTPPAQPAPVPASWMEMVTANLVREGVNKHKARELAEHFYGFAQRPFVGLTDEEVGDLSDFAYANDEEFVRNVEAKLKEKNT